MHTKILHRILTLGLTWFAVAAMAGDNWLTDFEAARIQAAKVNLPILINFTGSDWCGWCIRLDKEVFSQKQFLEFADDNLILLKVDFPRGKQLPEEVMQRNAGLARQYKVAGFPTILLVDAQGRLLASTGYRRGGPKAYVTHLQELLVQTKE